MECCGDPFAVGDDVTWFLDDRTDREWCETVLGPDVAGRITHAEEHHGDGGELPERSGRVVSIAGAWCDYAPTTTDQRFLHPVPGSSVLVPVDRADDEGGAAPGGLSFVGWVVDLELTDLDHAARA